MELSKVIEETKRRCNAGEELEEIVSALRQRGLSKVMSIRVLASAGLALKQAKEVVHLSLTWSDVREAHDDFSETAAEVAEENEAQDDL